MEGKEKETAMWVLDPRATFLLPTEFDVAIFTESDKNLSCVFPRIRYQFYLSYGYFKDGVVWFTYIH